MGPGAERHVSTVTLGSFVTEGLERSKITPLVSWPFKDSQWIPAELLTAIIVYVSARTMDSLKTLLVANRGEIAVRILKTARYVTLELSAHDAC